MRQLTKRKNFHLKCKSQIQLVALCLTNNFMLVVVIQLTVSILWVRSLNQSEAYTDKISTAKIENESKNQFNYYVKLGDPWNAICHTPSAKFIDWFFTSSFQTVQGRIIEKDVVNESIGIGIGYHISDDGQKRRLEIKQTDIHHAGNYMCYPDVSQEIAGMHLFKLILIEYSFLEWITNPDNQIILKLNVSFVGANTPAPLFKCLFNAGKTQFYDTSCKFFGSFTKCTLKVTYNVGDEIPSKCELSSKNEGINIAMDENFYFASSEETVYLEVGSTWSMACYTQFNFPMKWLFYALESNHENVTLYENFHVNSIFENKYQFITSDDNKTHTMLISDVNVTHAGIYKCCHQISSNFTGKDIKVVVIVKKSVERFDSEEQTSVLISISYIGPNIPMPTLKCFSENKLIMEKQCDSNDCMHLETFLSSAALPTKCQILFTDTLYYERIFAEPSGMKSYVLIMIVGATIVTISIAGFVLKVKLKKNENLESNQVGNKKMQGKEDVEDDYEVPSDVDVYHGGENKVMYEPMVDHGAVQNYSNLVACNDADTGSEIDSINDIKDDINNESKTNNCDMADNINFNFTNNHADECCINESNSANSANINQTISNPTNTNSADANPSKINQDNATLTNKQSAEISGKEINGTNINNENDSNNDKARETKEDEKCKTFDLNDETIYKKSIETKSVSNNIIIKNVVINLGSMNMFSGNEELIEQIKKGMSECMAVDDGST